MPGASEQTSQVKVLNVNWTAGAGAEDGRFEVMIVTADGEKHTFAPSPASLTVAGSGQDRRHPAMGSCRPDPDRRQHRRNLDRPDRAHPGRGHHAKQLSGLSCRPDRC
jgi:hypothetical protein